MNGDRTYFSLNFLIFCLYIHGRWEREKKNLRIFYSFFASILLFYHKKISFIFYSMFFFSFLSYSWFYSQILVVTLGWISSSHIHHRFEYHHDHQLIRSFKLAQFTLISSILSPNFPIFIMLEALNCHINRFFQFDWQEFETSFVQFVDWFLLLVLIWFVVVFMIITVKMLVYLFNYNVPWLRKRKQLERLEPKWSLPRENKGKF